MKLKTLAMVAAAGLSLTAMNSAFACQYTAWSSTTGTVGTTLVAGEPDDATPVSRYSGRCGSLSTALGNFATDNTPSAEANYRARFYVFTGTATGSPVVFRALDGAATPVAQITVTYNAPAGLTVASPGGSGTFAGLAANRWYAVELNWTSQGTPALNATVQGAGSSTALTGTGFPVTVTAGAVIETAQLGWVSGAATGTVVTDAFESRRSTAIGRLCRADANGDGAINVGDRVVMTNEILGTALSSGQPDCNEDGNVNVGDRVCVTNIILGTATCS